LLLTTNAAAVPLAAGSNYTQAVQVTLPLDQSHSPGAYYVIVETDYGKTQDESNEANNTRASAALSLTLPALPDLAVTNIVAPAIALPGQAMTVSWAVTNSGSTNVSGVWNETVYLGTNSVISNALPIALFTFTNTLAAGGSIVRTQRVTVPMDGPAGNLRLLVEVDSGM